jgi:hypothetical protein
MAAGYFFVSAAGTYVHTALSARKSQSFLDNLIAG